MRASSAAYVLRLRVIGTATDQQTCADQSEQPSSRKQITLLHHGHRLSLIAVSLGWPDPGGPPEERWPTVLDISGMLQIAMAGQQIEMLERAPPGGPYRDHARTDPTSADSGQ